MPENLFIKRAPKEFKGQINISGSKSESNRLLILKHLYAKTLKIKGLSTSNDTQLMMSALASKENVIDVEDAGTGMRFLLAYFSVLTQENITLKGSARMHQRPIGVLVKELRNLGAKIEYLERENYPPLKIYPSSLKGNTITIESGISSQYISALMMIAGKLPIGIHINLKGKTVSKPYLELTAYLMRELGLEVEINEKFIKVDSLVKIIKDSIRVEPDWSSASYWYLMVCLAPRASLKLSGFKEDSFQGDKRLIGLFSKFGIRSTFQDNFLLLEKINVDLPKQMNLDLIQCPDLAQSIVVAMSALDITGKISGLQTLKIKETDRLLALKTELEKTGAQISIGDDFLIVEKGISSLDGVAFKTWSDHRMAMSLAALSIISPISIQHPEVVNKSYPNFWEDMKQIGFEFSE